MWRQPWQAIALGILVLSAVSSEANACDTPVYRYAMYKWQPAPYELYLFHDGELTEEQQAVSAAVDVLNNDIKRPTNLLFYSVDVSKENSLDAVPADVREAFAADENRVAPSYMLFSPQGLKVYDGPVTAEDVEAISDSAGRQKVIENLGNGDACVLVLLSGISKSGDGDAENVTVDEEATSAAADVLLKLVNDVNAGKVELYSAPPKNPLPGHQPDEETSKGHTISMLQIDRTDPKEAWLVRMLMATESDLYDFDTPMVFPIYGRGRALPAFLGKGINADTITDYAVSFLTGACSCTVKEQNPGIDMLMRYDWDTVAEKVAAKFGAEEGNEFKFEAEDFFPNLLIPTSDTDVIEKPAGDDVTENDQTPESNGDSEVATNDPENSGGSETPQETDPAEGGSDVAENETNPRRTGETGDANEQPTDAPEQVAVLDPPANSTNVGADDPAPAKFTVGPVVIVGAGVGVVLLLLMGATFFMSRGSGI